MAESVFDKIIEKKKMPVLFIGSGLSRRYLYNFPNWAELLRLSFEKVNPDPFYYGRYIEQYNRQHLSDFEKNIKLASVIENDFNVAFYDRKVQIPLGHSKNPKWIHQGISPYKMFLVSFFKKLKLNRNPALLQEIEKFKQLKNKVSAIITTNYDCFLENVVFENDYEVFCHQNELFSPESYNMAEIYKIHGSITDAKSIVITEQDYQNFNASRKLIIAKMLTLFAESPIIFMGYSFTDENIQKIIEEFLGCLTSKELEHISDHFIFVSYKKGEHTLKEGKRTLFTANKTEIPITEIETDNFGAVYDQLNKIIPGISASRIRQTKRIVKQIVDQSVSSAEAESIIVGIDDLENIDISSKPLAIAIGYRENILSRVGYGVLSAETIIEDILFDNKSLDPDSMCLDRFKSLPITYLMPVFKYVKGCKSPIPEDGKLSEYLAARNSIEKIIPKTALKSVSAFPIASCLEHYHQLIVDLPFDRKAGILMKSLSNLSLSEIRTECQNLFSELQGSKIICSHFKRCVMYLDFMENYNEKS